MLQGDQAGRRGHTSSVLVDGSESHPEVGREALDVEVSRFDDGVAEGHESVSTGTR